MEFKIYLNASRTLDIDDIIGNFYIDGKVHVIAGINYYHDTGSEWEPESYEIDVDKIIDLDLSEVKFYEDVGDDYSEEGFTAKSINDEGISSIKSDFENFICKKFEDEYQFDRSDLDYD